MNIKEDNMKKTFTNEQMWSYVQLASRLHETGKLAYAIAKNTRKFRSEITEYTAKLDELLVKYGTPDKGKKGRYNIGEDVRKAYEAERKEYDSIEAEVDIMQVTEDVFTGGTLTNTQMDMLMWMVQ